MRQQPRVCSGAADGEKVRPAAGRVPLTSVRRSAASRAPPRTDALLGVGRAAAPRPRRTLAWEPRHMPLLM